MPSFCRPAITTSLPVTDSIAVMRMNISTTNNSTVISAAPRSRARKRDFSKSFHMRLSIVPTNSLRSGSLPGRARSVACQRLAGKEDFLRRNIPALHLLTPFGLQGHGHNTAADRHVKALNHRRHRVAAAGRHGERRIRLRQVADHPQQIVGPCGPGDTVADGALPDGRVRPPGGNGLWTGIRRVRGRHVAAREREAPGVVAQARIDARVQAEDREVFRQAGRFEGNLAGARDRVVDQHQVDVRLVEFAKDPVHGDAGVLLDIGRNFRLARIGPGAAEDGINHEDKQREHRERHQEFDQRDAALIPEASTAVWPHGRYRSTSSVRVTPRYCQVSVECRRTRYSLVVSTVQPDPGSVLYFTNAGGVTLVLKHAYHRWMVTSILHVSS